jgi:putative acetyltransferase
MTLGIKIEVTDPAAPEARRLIAELDTYLEGLYPPENNHLLSIEQLKQPGVTFLTAVINGRVVGCGAYVNRGDYAEIKRMYVMPEYRGLKIGRRLLEELETKVKADGLKVLRLETGVRQPAALRLYEKAGYLRRRAFNGYRDDEYLSVFLEKIPS